MIACCRNEERSGACGVAAKGGQHAMTASPEKGRAKSLSFWREEPRRGRPEGESSMCLREGLFEISTWRLAYLHSRGVVISGSSPRHASGHAASLRGHFGLALLPMLRTPAALHLGPLPMRLGSS